jgi:zinc transport system substrate-binding protein
MNRINLKILILVILTAIISLPFLECNSPSWKLPSGKLLVSTSFYPLYYFASQIGGDRAIVTNITPAGTEPHDYELTPRDIVLIDQSRLLILNGGGLEVWGKQIERNIDTTKTTLIIVGKGLTRRQLTENSQPYTDPHIWLSPVLAAVMVDRITQSFVAVDPADSVYFLANSDTLKARLDSLDQAYRQNLSNCATRDIITSHEAFGYLATAYGLRQVSIAGLSPDVEPSPRQLAEIASFARQNDIKYIFFESLASPKLARTIASEVGAQVLILNPLEGLTADEQAQGKNYFTVMRENLANLQKALLCKP